MNLSINLCQFILQIDCQTSYMLVNDVFVCISDVSVHIFIHMFNDMFNDMSLFF